jgi:hypothetical protein
MPRGLRQVGFDLSLQIQALLRLAVLANFGVDLIELGAVLRRPFVVARITRNDLV